MRFYTVAALVGTAFAQDGTCTSGLDQIGVEQSCLGRCHIYSAGEYGACFNYQFQASDIDSPCGDSPSNACKSTFNAAWDNAKANCGNCYYVEMPYPDGTVRSTYIKVVDTNASEVKFEMGQQAWRNLCPYVCAGTGECGHSPESCQYGTLSLPGWNGFDSCAVQYAPIKFKRVDCDTTGSDPTTTTTTTTPVPTEAPAVIPPVVTEPPMVVPPVQTVPPVVVPPVQTVPPMVVPPVQTVPPMVVPPVQTVPPVVVPPVNTEVPVVPPVFTDPIIVHPPTEPASEVATACANAVGYPYIPEWDEECKGLCHFYYSIEGRGHCPEGTAVEPLIQCVLVKHPYCQRV